MKRRHLAAICLAAMGFSASAVFGVERSWLNPASGDFHTAANWSGGVVPGTGDAPVFNLNSSIGYTISFSSNVTNQFVRVGNDRLSWNLNGTSYSLTGSLSNDLQLGSNAADRAWLTILGGGTMTSAGGVRIGNAPDSLGTLSIQNSNVSFNESGRLLRVGAASNATGSLLIGSAAVLHSNVAEVGSTAGSHGIVRLQGSGTPTWTFTQMRIGASGTGSVTVFSGTQLSGGWITLGAGAIGGPSAGTLTTSGTISLSQHLGVGSGGPGLLQMNGGTVATNADASIGSASAGTIAVNFGHFSSTLGLRVGGTIDTFSGALVGHGTLLIGSGTASTGSTTLGFTPGSTALARVGGVGTGTWNTGTLFVGQRGTGSVEILKGKLTAGGPVTVGGEITAFGSIVVNSLAAEMDAGANTITVGSAGTGQMYVVNGGTVHAGQLVLGDMLLSSGSARVDSAGLLSSTGSITVGRLGVASLTIDGGRVETGAAGVLSVGTLGSVNVNGGTLAYASLGTVDGAINLNSGTVEMLGSGTLGTLLGHIGPTLDGGQNLRINGTGTLNTQLTLRGGGIHGTTLQIAASTGELVLDDLTSAVNFNTVSNFGRIRGSGRIDAGTLTNQNPGEIRIDGGQTLRVSTTLNNNGQINLFGGVLDAGGQIHNLGTGRINGRGAVRASSINNSGTMAFSGGFSDIFPTMTNFSGGRIIVTGGGLASFYGNITNNTGAEIRVSDSSTAVFFGNVTGDGDVTGAGLKIFEFGTSSLGRLDTSGSTRVEAGASLTVDRVRENSLFVGGNVAIRPGGTPDSGSRLNSLTIDGGTLDIADNALLIAYSGGTPLPTIQSYIASAYAGGAWSGNGITSPLANASTHGLGFVDDTTLSEIQIELTRYGDANLDGLVNLADFNRLAGNFGSTNATWSQGDFNYDGIVNLADFNRLAANFGLSAGPDGPAPEDWSALAAVVPEPTAGSIAVVAIAALWPRRRRAEM